jgi:hypothetical protein
MEEIERCVLERVRVRIPPDVARGLKCVAREAGVPVGKVIQTFLRWGLVYWDRQETELPGNRVGD